MAVSVVKTRKNVSAPAFSHEMLTCLFLELLAMGRSARRRDCSSYNSVSYNKTNKQYSEESVRTVRNAPHTRTPVRVLNVGWQTSMLKSAELDRILEEYDDGAEQQHPAVFLVWHNVICFFVL
ncbi:hypothetical protein CPC08DRAFT_726335 [Agrocybe pediades]|nr:hypothetical protein CPC08DRAFT_726335 [Agrocybe pediades]